MHLMSKWRSLSLSKYSFHMKLIPQYVSAIKHAVTPKEIDLEFRLNGFPFYFTFVIFIRKAKLPCVIMSSHYLHLICENFLSNNLFSVEQLGNLCRKLNQHRIICSYFLTFYRHRSF